MPGVGNQSGNEAFLRVAPEGQATVRQLTLHVVRCSGCKSVWCPDQDLSQSYPPADPEILTDDFRILVDHYVELVGGLEWRVPYLERVPHGDRCRVIEVGCNTGVLLDYVCHRWGAEVVGLEPSLYGLVGRERFQLDIRAIHTFEHLDERPEPYDVVIATEVIEHVEDPVAFLTDLHRLVAPGGTVMLTTPNADGLDPARTPGETYAALSIGAHQFVLSARKLQAIARLAGFTEIDLTVTPGTLIAYLSTEPISLKTFSDPRSQLLQYYTARGFEDGGGAGRVHLADLIARYCLARELGSADERRGEREIDALLHDLFEVDVRSLGKLVHAVPTTSNIFEFGRLAPFTLAHYLFWRGHRDDLSETERTEMWEAALVWVGHGMAIDPVNLFVLERQVDPTLSALSGRESGRWRAAARAAIASTPELRDRDLQHVRAQMWRRVLRQGRHLTRVVGGQ